MNEKEKLGFGKSVRSQKHAQEAHATLLVTGRLVRMALFHSQAGQCHWWHHPLPRQRQLVNKRQIIRCESTTVSDRLQKRP
jgi:hypothetical protein